jgi:DNA polymerase-3 subunit beta
MKKLKMNTKELQSILSTVTSAVGKVKFKPILENVKIEIAAGTAEFSCTDLDTYIVGTVTDVDCDDGAILLPADKLFKIISAVDCDDVVFDIADDKVKIKSGGSSFSLAGAGAEDFPCFVGGKGEAITAKGEDFAGAVKSVLSAAAKDNSHHVINGIYIGVKDLVMNVAATDSHRLAVANCSVTGDDCHGVIFAQGLQLAARLAAGVGGDNIAIRIGDKLEVSAGQYRMQTALIDGTFPAYQKIIPKNNNFEITVNPEELMSALSQADIVADNIDRAVRLNGIGGKLRITAAGQSGAAEIDIDGDSADLDICFNCVYLAAMIKSFLFKDKIKIKIKDKKTPVVIEEEKLIYLLSPISGDENGDD